MADVAWARANVTYDFGRALAPVAVLSDGNSFKSPYLAINLLVSSNKGKLAV